MEPRARIPPEAGPLPDEEVVRRVRAGETALFEVLVRRHNRRVYRAVRSILRDEEEAEDAMQQAYLRAYAGLDGFAGASAVSTWLVRIAINEALGRLRRSARAPAAPDAPATDEDRMTAPEPSPESQAAAREAVHLVEEAVDRLSVEHRTVLMLRDVEELSTEETAHALGITEENVKIRLHRARGAVKEALYARVGGSVAAAFPFLAPRCDRVVAGVMARLPRPAADDARSVSG
jgi:RNA polymerase sigma-70 factor (ECF subfamily)